MENKKGKTFVSKKRFQEDCGSPNTKDTSYFNKNLYIKSLHEKMDKPKRYSMECDGNVHCITVMPGRGIHFHNHPDMEGMVHLVTFDLLQHPKIEDSTLPTCLKVLRGLRTGTSINSNRYNRSDVDNYMSQLLENNLSVKPARTDLKTKQNPKSWREECLEGYKESITTKLMSSLSYYGMKNEGYYQFKMDFNFCMIQSFMPSASMALNKDMNNYNRKELWLTINVSPKWLISIWKNNRMVIDKNLVLDIVKEYPNGTFLCMVAKQSHGFKIIPRLAVCDFERQAISWVIDKDRKEDLLSNDTVPRMRRTKKELEALNPKPADPVPVITDETIPF